MTEAKPKLKAFEVYFCFERRPIDDGTLSCYIAVELDVAWGRVEPIPSGPTRLLGVFAATDHADARRQAREQGQSSRRGRR